MSPLRAIALVACVVAMQTVGAQPPSHPHQLPPDGNLTLTERGCDTLGFAAGKPEVTTRCVADARRAWADLARMSTDAKVDDDMWRACWRASSTAGHFDVTAAARCDRYMAKLCPGDPTPPRDARARQRCIDAVDTRVWMVKRAPG